MEKHDCKTYFDTITTRCPPDSWDPITHVLWGFHDDSLALRTALRELENEWQGRAAAVTRLKRHLIQQIAVFSLAISVSLLYMMGPDINFSFWNIPWGSLTLPWPPYWMSAVVARLVATPAHKAYSAIHKTIPLVPLVMQMDGQSLPQWYAPTFKLRERSSRVKVQNDLQALLLLQRQCAKPAQAGNVDVTKASYIVAENVPDRSPVIQIPRSMLLSTVSAPPSVRDNCWIDVPLGVSGKKQPCFTNELMAFLLILEKQLQRQAIRKVSKTLGQTRLAAASLLPLPYCLIRTNRKNAPFFTAAQWRVIELLTHYRRVSVDRIIARMTTTFVFASDRARRGLLVGDAAALEDVLMISEAEGEESLAELDIQDAVSLVFSKGHVDVLGEVAVAPAAYDFETQLNVYSWTSNNTLQYRPDELGLTWGARGDYSFGSEVEVNHGLMSNLDLIYRFGIAVPSNPWGPVFLLRKSNNDGSSTPFGDQGWISVHTPLIHTTAEAELMLPHSMLTSRTTPQYGTMCFHRPFQKEQPVIGCPPSGTGSPPTVNRKNGQELGPLPHREGTADRLADFECDYRSTFHVFPFGYGSFMLHKLGPVGGLGRAQYQCLRTMLMEEGTPESKEGPPAEVPLLAAEERITQVLIKACSSQLESAKEATRILGAELRRQKSLMFDAEEECFQHRRSPCTTDDEGTVFLEKERVVDRSRRIVDVTQMMLGATGEFEALLQQCVSYFELVAEDIKMWKRVGLEF